MTFSTTASGLLLLLILAVPESWAQDLTVRVVSQGSNQPLPNVVVRLHYGCFHSIRPIERKETTDLNGLVIFHSLTLGPLEFCVFPDYAYAFQEKQPFMFISQEHTQEFKKYAGNVFTALPSSVTFHVRRLTTAERLKKLFSYD